MEDFTTLDAFKCPHPNDELFAFAAPRRAKQSHFFYAMYVCTIFFRKFAKPEGLCFREGGRVAGGADRLGR